jgi:hypothetical protein
MDSRYSGRVSASVRQLGSASGMTAVARQFQSSARIVTVLAAKLAAARHGTVAGGVPAAPAAGLASPSHIHFRFRIGVHQQPPANIPLPGSMFMMLTGRKKRSLRSHHLTTADDASVNTRIGGGFAGLTLGIKHGIVGLFKGRIVFVQCHQIYTTQKSGRL